jgi:nucleotide-binding universal stress UspA family protein
MVDAVRVAAPESTMKLTLKRILVPIDFSPPSDTALALASSYAETFGAALDLVHVMHITKNLLGGGSFVWSEEYARDLEKAALVELTPRLEALRKANIVCTHTLLRGEPHVELAKHAGNGHDMIIMGTHGTTGLAHALLGSVAERVVQHATCPVLVVPPPPGALPARPPAGRDASLPTSLTHDPRKAFAGRVEFHTESAFQTLQIIETEAARRAASLPGLFPDFFCSGCLESQIPAHINKRQYRPSCIYSTAGGATMGSRWGRGPRGTCRAEAAAFPITNQTSKWGSHGHSHPAGR